MRRRVAACRRGGYRLTRAGPAAAAALALLGIAASLLACAPPGTAGQPAPASVEHDLVAASAPARPLRILFDWTVREREARFSGRGVARIEPPYRARLDLFGPRGETYLSAAVVEAELRLPPFAAAAPVPPPPLLWSALGVFRPPPDAELVSARQQGEALHLEYREGGFRWRFAFEGGSLRQAEWEWPGKERQSVLLKGEAAGRLPREAVYRDWTAFVELVLTLDKADDVEPFPPEIWTPGAS
ncbi:MAG: hypothetical protein HY703_05130 [Gemmatimonadetes bacterium]|nr:hypothetical protein [Gemmatimonadota bacterium]